MPETRSKRGPSQPSSEAPPPKSAKRSRSEPKAAEQPIKKGGKPASSANPTRRAQAAAAQGGSEQGKPRKGRASQRGVKTEVPEEEATGAAAGVAPADPRTAAAQPSDRPAAEGGAGAAGDRAAGRNPEEMASRQAQGNPEDDDKVRARLHAFHSSMSAPDATAFAQDPGGHPFGRDFSSASRCAMVMWP